MLRTVTIVLTFSMMGFTALAHGGGLNSEGCHNNRKTGDYHCHQKKTTKYKPVIRSDFAKRKTFKNFEKQKVLFQFRNCTEARAAGKAPVRIGDPGYGRHLDRDNDGIGCE